MASTVDKGYTAYGARLFTAAAPYDPSAKTGGRDDDAGYLVRPGFDFMRPWLAIENDIAFQWPLGLQGFDYQLDPVLGTHSYIGDNGVQLDVINSGGESLTLSGSFAGDSAPALFQALREVVRRVAVRGKILFIPELMTHAQRVQVSGLSVTHDQIVAGRTLGYSFDAKIIGQTPALNQPAFTVSPTSSTAANRGSSTRTVTVNAAHRTLRQLAAWKLGSSNNWKQIYDASEAWFINHAIPKSMAPTYRLPVGTVLYLGAAPPTIVVGVGGHN